MSFIYTKFTGGTRFNDHSLPDELLGDVQTFISLIQKHARHLYLQQSGRSKVSKEYKDAFQLKITKLFPGSTSIAYDKVIEAAAGLAPILVTTTDAVNPVNVTPQPDFLKNSFLDITKILLEASRGAVVIPMHLREDFDRLGKHLRPEESFSVGEREDFVGAVVVNFAARQRIRQGIKLPYTQICEVQGVIDKVGVFDNSVMLKTNQKLITVTFAPYLKKKIRDIHFNTENYIVKFIGIGKYDIKDDLQSLVLGQHIIPFYNGVMEDYPSIEQSFTEIIELEPGWFELDEGEVFDIPKVEFCKEVIKKLVFTHHFPAPYIYPLPDSQISAEWSVGVYEISITFDLTKGNIVLFVVNTKEKNINKEILETNFSSSLDFGLIVGFFNQYFPGLKHVQ